MIDVRGYMLIT